MTMKTSKGRNAALRHAMSAIAVTVLTVGCGSGPDSRVGGNLTGPTSQMSADGMSAGMSQPALWGRNGDGGPADSGSTLLGGASAFAVFAASTITNTGPSVVNGDIGLTPGSSVTGFPPGTLTGTLHINDAATALAKLDLQTAYEDLASRPCDTIAPDLNSTLTPGVYCFTSSAQLNTALVLNGNGDPNAVFVFQIGSTLTTASSSSVTLTNGTSAANVFWQVGSSATLGTNTAFQGTIIAYSSVTMNTGASLANGRAMALNGAVTMDSNSITRPAAQSGGVCNPGNNGNHGNHGGHDKDKCDRDHGNHGGHDKDKCGHDHGNHGGHDKDKCGHDHGGDDDDGRDD